MTDLIKREETEMGQAFVDPVVTEYAQVGIVRYNAMIHTEFLLKERIAELEKHIDDISDFFKNEIDKSNKYASSETVFIDKEDIINLLGLEGYKK